MSERTYSDLTWRTSKYRIEHPVRSALIGGAAVFAFGFVLFDGDICPAIAGFVAAVMVSWWLWRPAGPMGRKWAERIAYAERGGLGESPVDPHWEPPQVPPTGGSPSDG